MTETLEDLRRRAERGALLLDARLPGWHQRLNLNALRMANSCRCVLGQLHGNYGLGLDAVEAPHFLREDARGEFAVEHGFTLPDEPDWWHADGWVLLRQAWAEEVLRRTEADLACAGH